jgi:hypothetical protein
MAAIVAAFATASAALALISAAWPGSGPASAASVCSVNSRDDRGSCSSMMASAVGSRSMMVARSLELAQMSMIAPSRSSGRAAPRSRLSSSRVYALMGSASSPARMADFDGKW